MQPNYAILGNFTSHNVCSVKASSQLATPLLCSTKRMLLSALMLLWLVAPLYAQTQTQANVRALPTGETLADNIGGTTKPPYEVALNFDEFFQVRVVQLDVDVLLRLLDLAGNEVARMTLPRIYQSRETLTFVASAAGTYRLEVSAVDAQAPAGRYTIRRESPRTATAQDQRRVTVESIFAEGMTARVTSGQAATAIQKFTEARAGWQELGDSGMADITALLLVQSQARATFIEARALLEKGSAESTQQAQIKFDAASKLYHEGGELDREAASLVGAALAASNLKKPTLVIGFLKQAFPLYSKPEDRVTKSDLLLLIVKFSISIGDDNTALEHLLLALPIYTELRLRREAAITAMTIGAYYYKFGDNNKAYEYLHGMLASRNILGDKCAEVEMLANLGAVTLSLDRKAEAVKFLDDELLPVIKGGAGCEEEKATAFNNLGKAYYNLNDFGLAVGNYKKALTVGKETNIKADTYLNLGAAYLASGRYNDAIKAYERASALYKDASERVPVEFLKVELNQDVSPLEQLTTILKLKHDIGDKDGEAKTQSQLSEVYLKSGDKPAALAAVNQALLLYGAINDRSGEQAIGNLLRQAFAEQNSRTARRGARP